MPTDLVSQISWFQSPLCGFAAEPTYSSEPADLLCLLHHPPSSSSIPCPIPQKHLADFGEQTHVPRLMGGRMCPLIVHPRPWSVTGYLAKINPLNKKYYQQEHNQISERRSSDQQFTEISYFILFQPICVTIVLWEGLEAAAPTAGATWTSESSA